MARSLTLLKPDNDNENDYFGEDPAVFKCNVCATAFQKPILATVSSSDSVQTYRACPHCLAKVGDAQHRKNKENEATSLSIKNVQKTATKPEEDAHYKNFFGYLNEREKDTPIPEECLTCSKMIECLLH